MTHTHTDTHTFALLHTDPNTHTHSDLSHAVYTLLQDEDLKWVEDNIPTSLSDV